MEDERVNKIKNLDNPKLIDVVKNYQRYNYPVEFRDEALKILRQRGINENALKISGNLENAKYDDARKIYDKINLYNNLAFAAYILSIFVYFSGNAAFGLLFSVIFLILMMLVYSNRNDFFKAIKETDRDFSMAIFLFIGIPMYFLVYFLTKRDLKEKLERLP